MYLFVFLYMFFFCSLLLSVLFNFLLNVVGILFDIMWFSVFVDVDWVMIDGVEGVCVLIMIVGDDVCVLIVLECEVGCD